MRNYLLLFCVSFGIAMGLTYALMNQRLDNAYAMVSTLENEVSHKDEQLLGYTQYTRYLTLGKQSLAQQMKLLAATVVRDESVTQVIEKSVLGISSTGTVAIFYSVEYGFGFDLEANSYDIKTGAAGIEIHIKKPALVAKPAVSQLRYQILSGGLFVDEESAILQLYAEASKQAQTQGVAMATEAPIIALCEKQLVAFLHDFLSKQPGVKAVPHIAVVYR